MAKKQSAVERAARPLICPKGYGLCWTCKTWCDMPKDGKACAAAAKKEK